MARFASGKFAWGICDYCGLRYKLLTLKATVNNGKRTGFLACCDCWSPDHPQNSLSRVVAAHGADAEALRDPRPDVKESLISDNSPTYGTGIGYGEGGAGVNPLGS